MPDQPNVPQPQEPTTPDPERPRSPDEDAPKEPSPLRNVVSFHGVRGQLIVAVLLAALGFAAVVQVRLTRTDEDFSGQRREELIQLLDSLSAAGDRAQTQIDDLENTRRELLSSSERRKAAVEESQRRLQVLQILAGTVPVVGPGITVTIDDPNGLVDEAALINAVGELREAGAEAIEINDSVRVVASTSFTTEDGVISADGVELRPPYVIDAIGSADTLSRALDFPGGLREQVEKVDGGHLQVEESNRVEVSSLHTVGPPEYSQPTDD
jgi:uncharacterized protein YlxW (UPF0749 family)